MKPSGWINSAPAERKNGYYSKVREWKQLALTNAADEKITLNPICLNNSQTAYENSMCAGPKCCRGSSGTQTFPRRQSDEVNPRSGIDLFDWMYLHIWSDSSSSVYPCLNKHDEYYYLLMKQNIWNILCLSLFIKHINNLHCSLFILQHYPLVFGALTARHLNMLGLISCSHADSRHTLP